MRIGWIGLGAIGAEMAGRLLSADYDVRVFARGRGLAAVEAAGAKTVAGYAALAAESDLLALCVFSDDQVREVLFDRGTLAAMRPGSILAIHTTGSPDLAREIGRRAPAGVETIDATFSGGAADVAAGRLTLMAGGSPDALERARPAFAAYAGQIRHVGPLGCAQKVKLLNNLAFAANLMNAAELLRMAEAQGLDAAIVAEVLQACSGASYAMNLFRAPAPTSVVLNATRPFLVKDVATAVATAAAIGLDLGAFAATADYFAERTP